MAWTNGGSTRTGTAHHKHFRRAVLKRDDYTCQRCGHHDPTGTTLHANHIINTKRGGTNDLDNGETLCIPCHKPETQREATQGRQRMTYTRPTTQHPGYT